MSPLLPNPASLNSSTSFLFLIPSFFFVHFHSISSPFGADFSLFSFLPLISSSLPFSSCLLVLISTQLIYQFPFFDMPRLHSFLNFLTHSCRLQLVGGFDPLVWKAPANRISHFRGWFRCEDMQKN
jgi:hypothetical protein